MASSVEIANRALTKLGASRITSFDDNNTQSRALKAMFDMVRDSELRARIWSFSKKRASLAALASTPEWGFDYEYQKPSDCLRFIQINDVYCGPDLTDYRNESTADYAIEGNKILANYAAPLKILYVSRVEDTAQWDATFVEAFACKLAFELAEDLTQSNTKKESAREDYKAAISAAIRANAIELPPVDLPADSWELSRL
jgi:hypothetical protein